MDLKGFDMYTYQLFENLRKLAAESATDEEFEMMTEGETFTTFLFSGEQV